jgi:hypothetical protein
MRWLKCLAKRAGHLPGVMGQVCFLGITAVARLPVPPGTVRTVSIPRRVLLPIAIAGFAFGIAGTVLGSVAISGKSSPPVAAPNAYEGTSALVPNVVDTGETAEVVLANDGFNYTVRYVHSDTTPKGIIVSQSPVAGQQAPAQTAVNLVVSAGP